MPAVIANASVVVYPSLYEDFGFPPLEAMAVGTPVVASNRGSLPEVLGDAALLVDPSDRKALGDAIDAVLTRSELRERLKQRGRAHARIFTWEKCTNETVELCRSVLAESGVRAA
jgi:glycosyltransferase involved in cell wall biosynthesis